MSGLEEQIFAHPRLEWIARKFDDDENSWKLMQIRRENFSHFRDWRFQWNAINPFAPLFVCEDFYQFPSNNKSFWPFDGENMPLVSPRNVSRITSTAGVLRDKIDNFLWENNFLSKNFYYSETFFLSLLSPVIGSGWRFICFWKLIWISAGRRMKGIQLCNDG